jgi:WD40 repeat protein
MAAKLALAVGMLLAVAIAPGLWAQPAPAKAKPPDAKSQQKARKLVEELLADEIRQAGTTSSARQKLIAFLFELGRETRDDLTARHALFEMAAEHALELGDLSTAWQALAEQLLTFDLDPAQRRVDFCLKVAERAKSPAAQHDLALAGLSLLQFLLDEEHHEQAVRILPVLDGAAKGSADQALLAAMADRVQEARRAHQEYLRVKPFAERLQREPADPVASQEMGKFYALVRGNWERALPLLARGKDRPWNDLAQRELQDPKTAIDQVALADAWSRLAQQPVSAADAQLLLHAVEWYQRAAAQLQGANRAKVDDRIRAILGSVPEEFRPPTFTKLLRRLQGHRGPVTAVAVARDGLRVMSAGADHSIRLWSMTTGAELKKLEGHTNWVRSVAFSFDGRLAFSGGDDNTVRLWDLGTGKELRKFEDAKEWVRCVALTPDGLHGLAGCDDGSIRVWDLVSGNQVRTIAAHKGFVLSLALSRDGTKLLTGGTDQRVRLWELATGKQLLDLSAHKGSINAVALSANGKRALSAGVDRSVIVWDLAAGKQLYRSGDLGSTVWSVALSPDGKLALCGTAAGEAVLWDVGSAQEVRRLPKHEGAVLAATFAPRGQVALTAGSDAAVWLWGAKVP